MVKKEYNISTLETFLNEILDGSVSDNTFFGTAPEASFIATQDWKDMCIVEIPNGIYDKDAYGIGTAFIWLYAKPLSSGRKNVAVMSALEKKLNDVINENSGNGYSLSKEMTYTDYDTEINWHCNVVELQILIV